MWDSISEKYKKLLGIVVITIVVYLGFRYLLPLFFPFLLAVITARILKRPVLFLWKKYRIRPSVSGAVLLILFLAACGGSMIYLAKVLLQQIVSLAENYEQYRQEWQETMQGICGYCDGFFKLEQGKTLWYLNRGFDGILLFFQNEWMDFAARNSLRAALSVTELAVSLLITLVATLLILSDMAEEKETKKEPGFLQQEWRQIRAELSMAGIAYVKTQMILIFLISAACSLGLLLLGNPYALLFGVMIGIFDAFPVLGSAMILLPWAAISFLKKNLFGGAVLLTMYGICQFIREYLEPKLLGGKMGISPLHSLMAVSIGYELFGIPGLFLGPFGLVLMKSLYHIIF